MHPALGQLDHRPYPIPAHRWTWRQNWHDLMFAHYCLSVTELRPLVPPELTIQEFDGSSWIGVVPFRMSGVMRRPLPDVPGLSAFPELNLRLYVERDGIPGVWFLSLDATNPLAIWAARRWFHLPYHRARIELTPHRATTEVEYRFRSTRRWAGQPLDFTATYRPVGEPLTSRPGTLEHFLTERYCLYARSPCGELFRTDVHHHPWPLRRAEGEVFADELLRPHGLSTHGETPLMHFAERVDVVLWSPQKLLS